MLMNRIAAPMRKREGVAAFPSSTFYPVPFYLLSFEPHDQGCAPVQPPGFLAGVVVLGPLLAVAHRRQPIGADAAAHEIVPHRSGAALAERQVVLRRAD